MSAKFVFPNVSIDCFASIAAAISSAFFLTSVFTVSDEAELFILLVGFISQLVRFNPIKAAVPASPTLLRVSGILLKDIVLVCAISLL